MWWERGNFRVLKLSFTNYYHEMAGEEQKFSDETLQN